MENQKKYVMKSCKYISAAVAALLLFSGCLHDKFTEFPDGGSGGKTTVAFSVEVPASISGGQTRANGGKLYGDNIYELDVMLVRAGSEQIVGWESISQDKIGGWDTDYKTFKVSFDVPDGPITYKLVVLANSYGLLTQKVFSNMDIDDRDSWITGWYEHSLRKSISFSIDPAKYDENASIWGIKGNPMWGETESTFTLPVETIPTIQLLRPYARIDLNVDPATQEVFSMTEYMLPHAFENLKIMPETANYNHATRKISWPDCFLTDDIWSISENTEGPHYSGICVADYPNADLWRPEFVILVKGRYGPQGTEGWYKVKMEDDSGHRLNILRNHQYIVTIRDVTGPGYPKPEEALESTVYLLADIAVWDEAAQGVVIEGNHYLRISRTNFSLAKEGFFSLPVIFETNYPGAGDKSGTGPNYAEGLKVQTLNPDWLFTIISTDNTAYKQTLNIVALPNETGAIRRGALKVTAGNMTYTIDVTQSTESWITVEPEVVVPLDGQYHKIDVSSNEDWGVAVSADSPSHLEKYIPVTTSSAENPNAVYFRTAGPTEYNVPYKVSLRFFHPEYGDKITKTIVTMCNLQGEANCYIVRPLGHAVAFPVSIANKTSLGQQIFAGEEIGYKIIWSDSEGVSATSNIQDIRILGKGPGAYLYVITGSKSGNAVIAATTKRRAEETWITEEDVVRWSWHIWVTDYDPDASSQTFLSKQGIEVTTMDRALGAMRSDPGDPATTEKWKLMRGLYYQWGRKDAFPLDIPVYDAAGSTGIVTHTDIGVDRQRSIMYPLWPSRDNSWNGFDGHNTWGTYKVKTVHDPCPEGWKIPFYNYWGRSDTSTDGTGTYNNTLTAMGAKHSAVQGDNDSGWIHWPVDVEHSSGYGGYFPCQGLRSNSSGFQNIINKAYGYQWCGIGQSIASGKFSFSYNITAGNNSGLSLANGAQNIRCVKE